MLPLCPVFVKQSVPPSRFLLTFPWSSRAWEPSVPSVVRLACTSRLGDRPCPSCRPPSTTLGFFLSSPLHCCLSRKYICSRVSGSGVHRVGFWGPWHQVLRSTGSGSGVRGITFWGPWRRGSGVHGIEVLGVVASGSGVRGFASASPAPPGLGLRPEQRGLCAVSFNPRGCAQISAINPIHT